MAPRALKKASFVDRIKEFTEKSSHPSLVVGFYQNVTTDFPVFNPEMLRAFDLLINRESLTSKPENLYCLSYDQ